MTRWTSTPSVDLARVQVYGENGWTDRSVKDLRVGDVARWSFDGVGIHPVSFELDEHSVGVVVEHPVRNSEETTGRDHGYGVMLDVYDSFDDAKRATFS